MLELNFYIKDMKLCPNSVLHIISKTCYTSVQQVDQVFPSSAFRRSKNTSRINFPWYIMETYVKIYCDYPVGDSEVIMI